MRADGFLRCGRLLKLPRVMALIEPQQTHDIPATFQFEARAGTDHLTGEFTAGHAVQVVVPNDCDLQNTIINEVCGRMNATGMVKGRTARAVRPVILRSS